MLNKTINRGLTAAFIVAMTVSILFMILPLVDIGNEMSWLQTMKENSVNTSTWIITVVFGISSIKLRRPVLKREQYCFDPHFVDRVDERNLLYAFLQADGSTDNRLFVVKGGMCRGKTVLLQRFADDVNGFYNDQIHRKRGLLRKKYSAYYIAISSSAEDILTEIGKTLSPHGNLDTYEKVKTFLRKASYTKNTVLLIDNISLYFGAIKKGQLDKEDEFFNLLLNNNQYSVANRGYHLAYYDKPNYGNMPFQDDGGNWPNTLHAFLRHFRSQQKEQYFLRRIDLLTMYQLMESRGSVKPVTEGIIAELERLVFNPIFSDQPEFQQKIEEMFLMVKKEFTELSQ